MRVVCVCGGWVVEGACGVEYVYVVYSVQCIWYMCMHVVCLCSVCNVWYVCVVCGVCGLCVYVVSMYSVKCVCRM